MIVPVFASAPTLPFVACTLLVFVAGAFVLARGRYAIGRYIEPVTD